MAFKSYINKKPTQITEANRNYSYEYFIKLFIFKGSESDGDEGRVPSIG